MIIVLQITIPTLVVTYCILLILIGIVVFAYPDMRSKRHDTFEKMHRFLGWTATAAVWVQVSFVISVKNPSNVLQVILLTNDYKDPDTSLARALRESTPLWLLVVMTGICLPLRYTCFQLAVGSIILPWLRLRKVPVRSEVLSPHAVRLYFDYGESSYIALTSPHQTSTLKSLLFPEVLPAYLTTHFSNGMDSLLCQSLGSLGIR